VQVVEESKRELGQGHPDTLHSRTTKEDFSPAGNQTLVSRVAIVTGENTSHYTTKHNIFSTAQFKYKIKNDYGLSTA